MKALFLLLFFFMCVLCQRIEASIFDFVNGPISKSSNAISQSVDGVTVTAKAYVAQFIGTNGNILGPFPARPESFSNTRRVGGQDVPVGLALLINQNDVSGLLVDDFGGGNALAGIDNQNIVNATWEQAAPEVEFVVFHFNQPVDINQVIVDDISNLGRSVWIAGGTKAPNLNGDLLNAFPGFQILNSSDDASDGTFIHSFSSLNLITYLVVGASLPISLGDLGPFQSTIGNVGFFITGLDVTPFTEGSILPENLIVLTHGWQPGEIFDPNGSYLPEVSKALEQRLANEGIKDKTKIIEFNWPEAFVEQLFPENLSKEILTGAQIPLTLWAADKVSYPYSYQATFDAGNRLALQALSFIRNARILNPTYDPKIHFIGHSLGTMVNSYAIQRIFIEGNRDISLKVGIEQMTILDDPRGVNKYFFYENVPFLSVGYVENFYASKSIFEAPKAPQFGDAIPGTFPCLPDPQGTIRCEGQQAKSPPTNHSEVHSQFYANRILSQDWESPALVQWNPPIAWDPTLAKLNTKEIIIYRSFKDEAIMFGPPVFVGEAEEITPGVFVLRTNSPASFGFTLPISDNLLFIRFKINVINNGSSTLDLKFNDELIWSSSDLQNIGSTNSFITIPIPFLSKNKGLLKWELNNHSSVPVEIEVFDIEFGRLRGSAVAVGGTDVNGDGRADLLWRNTKNGSTAIWLLDGSGITASGFPGGVPLAWQIAGIGDVNGDGKADVIWRHSTSATVAIWLMNGVTITTVGFPASVPTAWNLQPVGDVNGDGKADMIWRNSNDGNTVIWVMNGTRIAASRFLGKVSPTWQLAGAGDVNGDGKADLIWHNGTSHAVAIWLMNGLTRTSVGFPGSASPDFQLAGVGDVNGDSKADLVWRNTSNGGVVVWLLNGPIIASTGSLGGLPSEWKIVQVGDADGDGKTDVFWRNKVSGQVAVWKMNGLGLPTTVFPGKASTDWEIQ